MHEGSTKAVVAALAANAGIAVAKFVAFWFTRSSSMLAEAVHSVADSGNQALLLFGARRAQQPATAQFPFGFARERFFWSFVVALVLFVLGAAFAVHEGVEKLAHPHPLDAPLIAIGVLVIGIVLEGFSFRTAIHEAAPLRRGRSWYRFIRETKRAELAVVLLEDLGALAGLLLALAGVGLAIVTGDPRWDAWGTIAIGVLLGIIAVVLMIEMKGLLIGEGAAPDRLDAITRALADHPDVRQVLHLRTEHLGPTELLVAANVHLASHLDADGVADTIDALEARVRAAVPLTTLIYLEPDRR